MLFFQRSKLSTPRGCFMLALSIPTITRELVHQSRTCLLRPSACTQFMFEWPSLKRRFPNQPLTRSTDSFSSLTHDFVRYVKEQAKGWGTQPVRLFEHNKGSIKYLHLREADGYSFPIPKIRNSDARC